MIEALEVTQLHTYLSDMHDAGKPGHIQLNLTSAQVEYILAAIEVAGHPDDEYLQ